MAKVTVKETNHESRFLGLELNIGRMVTTKTEHNRIYHNVVAVTLGVPGFSHKPYLFVRLITFKAALNPSNIRELIRLRGCSGTGVAPT